MTITVPLSFLLLFIYFLVFRFYRRAWKSNRISRARPDDHGLPAVSVVVPFRNEEKRIHAIAGSLAAQDYPRGKAEFIFVNDHSTDRSVECLLAELSNFPGGRLVHQTPGKSGKKNALMTGIGEAGSELIVITDADCRHPVKWLSVMARQFVANDGVLVSGPVRMMPAVSFFQRFQALEFAALTGTGGASFLSGSPVLCNGANLAFKRGLFLEAFPELHEELSSGDDMFLMLWAKKHCPSGMHFVRHPDAIVETQPVQSYRHFLQQRIRWASKSGHYRDTSLILLSILVFSLNAWIVVLLFLSLFNFEQIPVLIGVFTLKSLIDFYFLKPVCRFYDQEYLLKILLPSQLFYPFYILVTALSGFFINGKNK